MKRRTNQAIAIAALCTIALVGLDLWSKSWAEGALSTERRGEAPPVCSPDEDGYSPYQRVRRPGEVIIEDVFELEYAENCGAAFGLLRSAPVAVRTTVFGIAATAASIFLFWYFVIGRGGPFFAWSVPLVVSGALGNLIDRIRYGYVVDFIHFHWGEYHYPTFNVADIAITVGVILLLVDGFRSEPGASDTDKAGPKPADKKAAAAEAADEGEDEADEEEENDSSAARTSP